MITVVAGLGALGGMLGLGFGLMWFMGTKPKRHPVNVHVNPEDPQLTAARIRWYSANARLAEAEEAERAWKPHRFHHIHAKPIPKHSGRPEIGTGR